MGELSERDLATSGGSWSGLPLMSLPLNGKGRNEDVSAKTGDGSSGGCEAHPTTSTASASASANDEGEPNPGTWRDDVRGTPLFHRSRVWLLKFAIQGLSVDLQDRSRLGLVA